MSRPLAGIAPAFADFWVLYPRKEARAHAEKIWNKLSMRDQQAAMDALPLHCEMWVATKRQRDKTPHGGSWLNGRRFEDVVEIDKGPGMASLIEAWSHVDADKPKVYACLKCDLGVAHPAHECAGRVE